MHHEYLCTHVQPVAVRYHMGMADAEEVRTVLADCHGAAITLSDASIWGDSSNKLSWIIPVLADMFPDARFVHVVRDGRKVASSYFHKLGDECYPDAGVAVLESYRNGAPGAVKPPPEKRYWWPLPPAGTPAATAFDDYDQFQRIVYHWAEVNRTVIDHAARLPAGSSARFRLEDLIEDSSVLASLFSFIGLDFRHEHFAEFRRPHNVNRPFDKLLDAKQRGQLDEIVAEMMSILGYRDTQEYSVDYNPVAAA